MTLDSWGGIKSMVASILLLGVLHLPLFAEVNTVDFGSMADWQKAIKDGLELEQDSAGFARVSPMSEEWSVDRETELLLHFNQPNEPDVSGRHQVISSYQPSSTSTQGGGALFLSGRDGVQLRPSADSFLGGGRDSSAFSVQFWFKPSYTTDGEFLFEWDGLLLQGQLQLSQRLSSYFKDQRLVWEFDNLFLHPDQPRSRFQLKSEPLVPNRWYYHFLYYDSSSNQIELSLDNQVVDVYHSTSDASPEGEPLTLVLGNPYRYPFVVGKKFYGYIDEFRISMAVSPPFNLRQPVYRSVSSAVLPPLDLGSNGASVIGVRGSYHVPDRSQVVLYYRVFNERSAENVPLGPSPRRVADFEQQQWRLLPFGQDLAQTEQNPGRFLLLKLVFLGDVGSYERPWVSNLSVKYNRPLPLPAPANLRAEQVASDALRLHWAPIVDSRVAGYRIFIGLRSHIYLQQGEPIDAGLNSSYVIRGLQPQQQYYLTVVAYDHSNPEELGDYATEQSVHLLPYFSSPEVKIPPSGD